MSFQHWFRLIFYLKITNPNYIHIALYSINELKVLQRRDAHPTAEKLQHLKEKMTYKIANVTCMLKELNWIKEDKTPNYETFETYLNEVTDPYLKKQMFYGMD